MLFLQGTYRFLPKVTQSLNIPNSAILSIQEEFMLCHKFMLQNCKLIKQHKLGKGFQFHSVLKWGHIITLKKAMGLER